jgi:hypothetical protein
MCDGVRLAPVVLRLDLLVIRATTVGLSMMLAESDAEFISPVGAAEGSGSRKEDVT